MSERVRCLFKYEYNRWKYPIWGEVYAILFDKKVVLVQLQKVVMVVWKRWLLLLREKW